MDRSQEPTFGRFSTGMEHDPSHESCSRTGHYGDGLADPADAVGRFSSGVETTPHHTDNVRIGTFADGMTAADDRLRMLDRHARTVATLGSEQRTLAESVLEESVRASYEYGATEDQIAEAANIERDDVRRMLTPRPMRLEKQE